MMSRDPSVIWNGSRLLRDTPYSTMHKTLAIIILAAGQGKRMNNPDMAKVLYPVGGKPMIDHVIDRALECKPTKVVIVVGHQKDAVITHCREAFPLAPLEFVEQREQRGTGHAVMQAEPILLHFTGEVLVLSGDVPLLTHATLVRLLSEHRASAASVTMITADLDDATGYGRILRTANGSVQGIIEHKDATDAQRRIAEINAGIYCFDATMLFDALKHIAPDNAQGEYYLTDVLGIISAGGRSITAVKTADAREVMGVNTVEQLERMNAEWGSGRDR